MLRPFSLMPAYRLNSADSCPFSQSFFPLASVSYTRKRVSTPTTTQRTPPILIPSTAFFSLSVSFHRAGQAGWRRAIPPYTIQARFTRKPAWSKKATPLAMAISTTPVPTSLLKVSFSIVQFPLVPVIFCLSVSCFIVPGCAGPRKGEFQEKSLLCRDEFFPRYIAGK